MAKCPYCKKEVQLNAIKDRKEQEVQREIKGAFKKEVMYSCPHCDAVLGFAFFFGGLGTGRP